MNQSLQNNVYPASWMRRAVALYYDLLVVSTALSPLILLVHRAEPSLQQSLNIPRYLLIATFVFGIRMSNKSFGKWVTGIDQNLNQVDPSIYKHETLVTIVVGFMMIAAGFEESIARIFEDKPMTPIFGYLPSSFLDKVCLLISGGLEVWCGIEILKLRKRGYWLGIIFTAIGCLSAILNWHYLSSYMSGQFQTKLTHNEAAENLSYMASNYPYIFGSFALFIVTLFFLNRKRFVH